MNWQIFSLIMSCVSLVALCVALYFNIQAGKCMRKARELREQEWVDRVEQLRSSRFWQNR